MAVRYRLCQWTSRLPGCVKENERGRNPEQEVFYDKTVLICKVEARSDSESQQRIMVWCLGVQESCGEGLLNEVIQNSDCSDSESHGVGVANI